MGAVAAGSGHTVGLKTDGTLWAWGANYFGQLGDATTVSSSTPVRVALPEAPIIVRITDIASPGADAAAVNEWGEIVGVYAPVEPDSGQAYIWTPATGLIDLGTLGGNHTRAVDINSRGEIAGSGKDSSGRLAGFRLRPLDPDGVPVWYQDGDGDGVNDLMEPLVHQEHQIEIAAINAVGIIGGDYYASEASHYRRGMLWLPPDNTPVDLGGRAGCYTLVSDLNDLGLVIGYTADFQSSPVAYHPYVIVPMDGNGDGPG